MRAVIAFVAALALWGSQPAAAQDDDAADVVELTTGGRLRGQVLVYEPGQDVTIRLPTGETRTLRPQDVREVRLGQTGDVPRVQSTAPPPAPEEPPAPQAESALVSAVETRSWELANDLAVDTPWEGVEERVAYRPVGAIRVSVEARAGVYIPLSFLTNAGALAEAGMFVHARPVANGPYRASIGVVLRAQTDGGVTLDPDTTSDTALFGILVRAFPLGLDLGDIVTLRVGGELGIQHINSNAFFAVAGGLWVQSGFRFADGVYEVGVDGSVGGLPFGVNVPRGWTHVQYTPVFHVAGYFTWAFV